MKTTFVIPTYNEAENLPKLVQTVFELPVKVDLLILDDNSPDGTGDLAEQIKSFSSFSGAASENCLFIGWIFSDFPGLPPGFNERPQEQDFS